MESKSTHTQDLHKNRPLSPHLSIYRLQLTSGLSILHRITGAYLYFGLIIMSWVIFNLVYFPNTLENIMAYISNNNFCTILFKAAILSWIFALFYHQLNGVRHLFWDVGKGFEIKDAYMSGIAVVSISILLTIVCWVLV
jgi:succinate dehydrogenase / fumarate reductase, cytochrome b subunit